jgi:PIN domain nuclease of toxin-antitoxin system
VDRRHVIWFSVVSIWEMAIKASLGREDFQVNPPALRLGLLEQGFLELPIQVSHVLAVQHLPRIHRDRFDRLLVAQAAQERLSLITADRTLLGYGDGVRWVG